MLDDRQVVLTGMGVASPIGVGVDAYARSLSKRHSGVRRLEIAPVGRQSVDFGGEVLDFEPKQHVKPRKSLKVMCRETQLAFAAAAMATDVAGLPPGSYDPDRFGVIFGSEFFYFEPEELIDTYRHCSLDGEFHFDHWDERAIGDMNPLWLLRYLPNMPACHVGIYHDARGPNNTIVLGEASGLLALIEAAHAIGRGMADAMIVGSVGSRLPITARAFRGEEVLSHRTDDPASACRPFDADRDGIVNAEGAAAVVLETAASAQARGATVIARFLAGAAAFESPQAKQRTGAAIAGAIRQTLGQAGCEPGEIGHVNAHGASTPVDDALEARAIADTLGDVPVTAPKSFFGNAGSGCAVLEFVATLVALRDGDTPVTLNYESPDPRCPVNVVHGEPAPLRSRLAMVLSQSSTGQAAAVLLGGA